MTSWPSENSVNFYLALRKAGVPAELHVFEKGPHGVGLDLSDPAVGEWPKLLEEWLRGRGLLSPPRALILFRVLFGSLESFPLLIDKSRRSFSLSLTKGTC